MMRCLLLIFLCALSSAVHAQFSAMFWNVENFFDTRHDSLKMDSAFLPSSVRKWNSSKYKKKVAQVARVLVSSHGWDPPVLVGLCEVENEYVMKSLVDYGPLSKLGYRYVITASDDVRGIDVALVYRRDRFKLLGYQSVRVDVPDRPTRDILHVTGRLLDTDTLDVVVAHLPSKVSGRKSEYKRRLVAERLKMLSDSISAVRKHPRILLMGDFNDGPNSDAVRNILKALPPSQEPIEPDRLYHLLHDKVKGRDVGSYKYKGRWELLDHLIVSGSLLDSSSSFYTSEASAQILQLPFLLIPDEKFGGDKPFRTYNGLRYQGGYSDHLPVLVEFQEVLDWNNPPSSD